MKILILGLGLVGSKLAERLTADGHYVIGTTTTSGKVERLNKICNIVAVLTGDAQEYIKALGQDCDAIVVTVGPNLQRATNPSTREDEYRLALSVTCRNAASANPRVIFASSFSVYGDGGPGSDPITEETSLTLSQDVSPHYYQEAEGHILATGQGTVLRFPDIYGREGDISYTERVKLGHTLMGGRVPFSPDALLYRVHAMDAARAIQYILEKNLMGVYNVVDNHEIPPTNQEVFDRLADRAGIPHLTYANRIKLPARKISAEKLVKTGFWFEFTDYVFE